MISSTEQDMQNALDCIYKQYGLDMAAYFRNVHKSINKQFPKNNTHGRKGRGEARLMETLEQQTELQEVKPIDDLFRSELRKPISKGGKLYINPFGLMIGENLSGADRGQEAVKDKAFMASVEKFGVISPVQVKLESITVAGREAKAYLLLAGNRRTCALRHLIATSKINADDPRAMLPIYEANEIRLENVSHENAVNLLENAMRSRIDPIARAEAIQELIDKGASTEEIAYLVTGKGSEPLTERMIKKYLNLLKLHPSVREAVRKGTLTIEPAQRFISMSHEEQARDLQTILDAQKGASNKRRALEDAIDKVKNKKRRDREGNQMFDPPRSIIDVRKAIKDFQLVENWDCLPNSSKLPSKEAYAILCDIWADFATWTEGGLTRPSALKDKGKDREDQVTLALKTRVLANLAKLITTG